MAISRAFHNKVMGIEFGSDAAAKARATSLEAPISSEPLFMRGDAEPPPLKLSSFDAVVYECSMSILPDKPSAVEQVKTTLRPGGRCGLSYVTLEPTILPQGLNNVVGRFLCLADTLYVAGYVYLLTRAGMSLHHQEDASQEMIKLPSDQKASQESESLAERLPTSSRRRSGLVAKRTRSNYRGPAFGD
jgi:arsenite methyltransferase